MTHSDPYHFLSECVPLSLIDNPHSPDMFIINNPDGTRPFKRVELHPESPMDCRRADSLYNRKA